MSWLFRRRIRVIPGVRLNLSKSGVTASIGVRGASITLGGKGGTYANVGIPGTGIYSRRKIGGGKNSVLDNSSEGRFHPEQYEEESFQPDEVFVSEDPLDITSDGLMALQEAVLAAAGLPRADVHAEQSPGPAFPADAWFQVCQVPGVAAAGVARSGQVVLDGCRADRMQSHQLSDHRFSNVAAEPTGCRTTKC